MAKQDLDSYLIKLKKNVKGRGLKKKIQLNAIDLFNSALFMHDTYYGETVTLTYESKGKPKTIQSHLYTKGDSLLLGLKTYGEARAAKSAIMCCLNEFPKNNDYKKMNRALEGIIKIQEHMLVQSLEVPLMFLKGPKK